MKTVTVIRPDGSRIRGSSRGIAMVIVMMMLMLLSGLTVTILENSGTGLLTASTDQKITSRTGCTDRLVKYLMDQIGDWKLITARIGSSGRCATIYNLNMTSIPAGDVPPASGTSDWQQCFSNTPATCPATEPCAGNPAWNDYMQLQGREQARFYGQNSITDTTCPETRAIATFSDSVKPLLGDVIGQQVGIGAGTANDCRYQVRIFAMYLPSNDQRFYSNYLDVEVERKLYSSTGCSQ